MSFAVHRSAVGAFLLVAAVAGRRRRTTESRRRRRRPPEKSGDSGVARYCANVAPVAAEARIAWESRRLNELDAQLKQRIAELEKTEAETRDWVNKREAMLNAASDDVVAIYSKMDAEAAAAQLGGMDEPVAVAILHKLKTNARERDPQRNGGGSGGQADRHDLAIRPRKEIVMGGFERKCVADRRAGGGAGRLRAAGRTNSCASRACRRSGPAWPAANRRSEDRWTRSHADRPERRDRSPISTATRR